MDLMHFHRLEKKRNNQNLMEGSSMDWSLHNLQFEGMHVFGNKMYQLTMAGASTCDSNESSKL
jgi:hypothetical protein